jgi:hypothetical protein
MTMANTEHRAGAGDKVGVSLAVAAAMAEGLAAAAFTYEFECYEPTDEDKPKVAALAEEFTALERAGLGDSDRCIKLREEHANWPRPVRVWAETAHNSVTRVGAGDMLDKYFAGSGYTAAWYLGLIGSTGWTAVSTADTMSSHSGWQECGGNGANTPTYSSGTRPSMGTWSAASTGSNSVTKSPTAAISFTFSDSGTVKGGFIASNSTKSGTTGTLYSAAAFSGGDQSVTNTAVINVTVTLTQTVS